MSPFRSETPKLEEQLRVLEEELAGLLAARTAIAHEHRLRRRWSGLVLPTLLVAMLMSCGGLAVGRLTGQKRARQEMRDRLHVVTAAHADVRKSAQACEAEEVHEREALAACGAQQPPLLAPPLGASP